MKIVHAADLHLDSPLLGLERYAGAPVEAIRGATRRAFENLVSLCLEEEAGVLLIAGDVYDGDWKDYSTGLFFATELNRLRDGVTKVVMVRGNHDAASQITRHLRLPEHVTELDSARPVTRVFEDSGIAVHGQSFRERAVKDDLASSYPAPLRGAFNVGLLHTSVSGRRDHDDYAPCTLETLVSKGYDYFALGHVHRREVLSERPWVVFPGNLQGRQARESGAKGATLIDVRDGHVHSVEARTLDVVRWFTCAVDASAAANAEDAMELVRAELERVVLAAEGRTAAVRVVVSGRTRAHSALAETPERWEAELRSLASEITDELWLERIQFSTSAELDLAALAAREDAIGQVARALSKISSDDDAILELVTEFTELRNKLPPEARVGADAVLLDDPEFMREALRDVEQVLLPALAALGSDECSSVAWISSRSDRFAADTSSFPRNPASWTSCTARTKRARARRSARSPAFCSASRSARRTPTVTPPPNFGSAACSNRRTVRASRSCGGRDAKRRCAPRTIHPSTTTSSLRCCKVRPTSSSKAYSASTMSVFEGSAQDLLAGKGNVGESLFAAGVGGSGIHELSVRLSKEAEELFAPRARERKVTRSIAEVKDARDAVRQRATSPSKYLEQQRGLEEANRVRASLRAKRASLASEQAQLSRAVQVLPGLRRHAELHGKLTALGAVVDLAADSRERRTRAVRDSEDARREEVGPSSRKRTSNDVSRKSSSPSRCSKWTSRRFWTSKTVAVAICRRRSTDRSSKRRRSR